MKYEQGDFYWVIKYLLGLFRHRVDDLPTLVKCEQGKELTNTQGRENEVFREPLC